MSLRAALLPLAVLVLLAGALVGCGGDDGAGEATVAPPSPQEALAVVESGDRVVIDVRTPEEYAAGHVEGADNLDAQAPDFDEQVADLDRDAAYVVYCQTGNRSATAAETMREQGLDVVDAGGIEGLEDEGATVVR